MFRDINRLLSIIFVSAAVLLLLVPPTSYAAAQVSSCGGDFRILQGSDDAEEKTNGDMVLGDTLDLDLAQHEVGVRFQGVTVPQGAIITKAFIQFTAEKDDEETNSAGVFIFAEDTDNSQTFSTNTNDITSRTKTISTENWFIPQWPLSGTDAGLAQRTPDLSSLAQEVVNRVGWSSSNAMSFIFITYNDGDRDTKTFESDNPNQHDDNAALLRIECFVPDPNVCQDVLLNFDGLPHGARLGNPDGSDPRTIHWKLAPYGIEASGIAHDPDVPYGQGLDTLIVYDSHFSRPSSTGDPDNPSNVGQDPDLEHPFNPNADPLVEGTPIIPTNDDPQVNDQSIPVASPNDWRNGGTATYQFDHDRILKKLTGVDDLNTIASMVTVFSDRDCTQQIGLPIPIDQNDDDRGTHVYDFEDISGVRCIKDFHPSSGGLTNFDLGCDQVSVCDNVSPPGTSGDGDVLASACIERAAEPPKCVGLTLLTVEYSGDTPVTITAVDKKGQDEFVIKSQSFDQPPVEFTILAEDATQRDGKLPPNTIFRIDTVDDSSGEILVADDNTNAIIKVDPATGQQTLISQDKKFDDPENLLIDSQGRLLVAEGDFPNEKGSILKVNPADGSLTIFTSGGFFNDGPEDLVEDSFGNIYVLDDGARKVIKVSPSGDQSPFAEFNFKPEGITIDDVGNIIVVGGSGNGAKVISITPGGTKTVVSENQLLVRPEGVAFDDNSGLIYVADGNAGDENNPSQSRGQIVSVDPNDPDTPNSNQELISPTGPPFVDPSDVEIFAGKLIISDDAAGEDGMGAIIELNPLDRNDWRIISSNPISKAVSGAELFDSPEGLFIGPFITQEEITIHTSCSKPIEVGNEHGSLTITQLCKIFDNGQEQCFTLTGGPYPSLYPEVQYEQTSPPPAPVTNNLITNSGNSGGSSSSQGGGDSYTEEPDIITNQGEQGEFSAGENFLGVTQGESYFNNQVMLTKMGKDIFTKLQQEDVIIDKRLQSLLEKLDSGEYFGKISKKDQEPKSYSISIDGSASSIPDSTITDFTGKIYIETIVSSDKSSKFIVNGGQLIIRGDSYDIIFGKAKLTYSDKDNSMIILAEILNPEGDVHTLRLSFDLELSLQDNLLEPINFVISQKSKIAKSWNLDASGQLSLLEN